MEGDDILAIHIPTIISRDEYLGNNHTGQRGAFGHRLVLCKNATGPRLLCGIKERHIPLELPVLQEAVAGQKEEPLIILEFTNLNV